MIQTPKNKIPPFRKLRGYAFDPSLSLEIDKVFINNIVYKVLWENENRLVPGPVGEYLEVIDFDPTTDTYYRPVDLNDRNLLAQDGLEPSESNPQFHQQMVYAVAMTTIRNFENALGRKVDWSPHTIINKEIPKKEPKDKASVKNSREDKFVRQLRIYPHAFRDANAYYSPQKKALLFGYFSAEPASATLQMPGSIVYTCLSHDIIAHETTHAILDGMYRKYTEDTNPDMLAFHEAFADIVALFQHFTFPDVLKHQIAQTRGDLSSQNLLGQLAQEFGTAIGGYGALRDAIGSVDPETKKWKHKEPNGDEYNTVMEPHARGSILVAAVFEAFLTIYKNRVADLLRIASGGSGQLAAGELHPDLVHRLATEASKSASHVLRMCIRALDYSPPLDITFGDFLRAIVTADTDLVSDDSRSYRVAFIDAFRKRGIYPTGIKNLSVESLAYSVIGETPLDQLFQVLSGFLREYRGAIMYKTDREEIFELTRDYIAGQYRKKPFIDGLHKRIYDKFDNMPEFERLTGLVLSKDYARFGIHTSNAHGSAGPSFGISSLKCASRSGPNGEPNNRIILALTQRAGIRINTAKDGTQTVKTFPADDGNAFADNEFIMTAGATMIFDLDTMKLKYTICKPLLDMTALGVNKRQLNEERALELSAYYHGSNSEPSLYEAYFGMGKRYPKSEPFCFLHNH